MNKNLGKTTQNIYDKYRKILEMPNLSDKKTDKMRYNVKSIAMTACEQVWKVP